MPVQKVFGDNSENEEDTVGIVRNDQIRKDCMGVSTTADNPHDFDRMINRASLDEINQISLVRSVRCKNERPHKQDRIPFQGGIQP